MFHLCCSLLFVFQFNPLSPLSERDLGYNRTPCPDDQVHVLVCVISANSTEIKDSVLQKMKTIRETASDLGKNPDDFQ